MLDPIHYDLILQAIKVLFLTCLPILAVLSVAGILSSILQVVTGIHDPALSYAVRVLALIALLYFLIPSLWQSIVSLAEMALH